MEVHERRRFERADPGSMACARWWRTAGSPGQGWSDERAHRSRSCGESWISIYDERSESQAFETSDEAPGGLARHLDASVVTVGVIDSDVPELRRAVDDSELQP